MLAGPTTGPVAALPAIDALKAEELRVAEELQRDFPLDARAIGILGNVYSGHGLQSRAVAYWEKALALDPKDAWGYDAMARVAFLNEDLDRAVELSRKAAALDASLPGVWHRLGQALMLAGKTEEAIDAFTRDLARSPRSFESHFFLGQLLAQGQRHAEANAHYARAVAIEPRYVKAYYGMAMAHTRLGEREKAEEAMRRFSEFKSKAVAADIDLRGVYDDAESFARRMAGVLTGCGDLYVAANRPGKAEELWRRAAVLDRTALACRANLARLMQQSRREKEALALCRELCALEPANGLHLLNVGILQLRGKDLAGAEDSFKKVCEMAPDHSDGFRMLARLYLEGGDRADEAVRCAQRAAEIEPVGPNYLVLGDAFAARGERLKAREAMERAIALEPQNPEYRRKHEKLLLEK